MVDVPYSIIDVAQLLGLEFMPKKNESPDEKAVRCPYCGKKASIVARKNGNAMNVFHCFHCDTGCNMHQLAADYWGIGGVESAKEAAKRIREEMGLNDHEKYQNMAKKKAYKEAEEKINEKEAEPVDISIASFTYSKLLRLLILKDDHRADLIRRGLTPTEIDAYPTASMPDKAETKGICKKLLEMGCVLKGVRGFYQDTDGEWTINTHGGNAGYLCPVYFKGYIIGFQIHLDTPKDGQKYCWLTSAGRKNGCSQVKLPTGETFGAPATVYGTYLGEEIVITEGVLKAYVYHCMTKNPVVGVAGVTNIKCLEPVLKTMPNLKKVWTAFDMDMFTNPNVKKAQGKLFDALTEWGYTPEQAFWDCKAGKWDGEFKGIDDYYAYRLRGIK